MNLYKAIISPKKEGQFTPIVFYIAAKGLIEAATKMNTIQDIDYMYDPEQSDVTFSYEGIVY